MTAEVFDGSGRLAATYMIPPGSSWNSFGSSNGDGVSMFAIDPVIVSQIKFRFWQGTSVDELEVFGTRWEWQSGGWLHVLSVVFRRSCDQLAGEVQDVTSSEQHINPKSLVALGSSLFVSNIREDFSTIEQISMLDTAQVSTVQGQKKLREDPAHYPQSYWNRFAYPEEQKQRELAAYEAVKGLAHGAVQNSTDRNVELEYAARFDTAPGPQIGCMCHVTELYGVVRVCGSS